MHVVIVIDTNQAILMHYLARRVGLTATLAERIAYISGFEVIPRNDRVASANIVQFRRGDWLQLLNNTHTHTHLK